MEEKYLLSAKYIDLSDLRNVPKLNSLFAFGLVAFADLFPHSLTYHLMFHLKLLPTRDQIKHTAALTE